MILTPLGLNDVTAEIKETLIAIRSLTETLHTKPDFISFEII